MSSGRVKRTSDPSKQDRHERPVPQNYNCGKVAKSKPSSGNGRASSNRPASNRPASSQQNRPPQPECPRVVTEEREDARGHRFFRKYIRGELLGKGGFAKCYLFTSESKRQLAGKVVCKASLKRSRAKQKLIGEITIHRSINHQHIVKFERTFEDRHNVYILLEVCRCHTLMELVKRRKCLTEPEVKYYGLQIIDAVMYLHKERIIHRDLKLGNLFLDESKTEGKKLKIKVGDFGLATKLSYEQERKQTICGTPNYILGGGRGHSYEVDIWSLGCILYTMLIGKPPFQTRNVKTTYKRIKANSYSFPPSIIISREAKDLIKWILSPRPESRPTLLEMKNHPFFNSGFILTVKPFFPYSTSSKRHANTENIKTDLNAGTSSSARRSRNSQSKNNPEKLSGVYSRPVLGNHKQNSHRHNSQQYNHTKFHPTEEKDKNLSTAFTKLAFDAPNGNGDSGRARVSNGGHTTADGSSRGSQKYKSPRSQHSSGESRRVRQKKSGGMKTSPRDGNERRSSFRSGNVVTSGRAGRSSQNENNYNSKKSSNKHDLDYLEVKSPLSGNTGLMYEGMKSQPHRNRSSDDKGHTNRYREEVDEKYQRISHRDAKHTSSTSERITTWVTKWVDYTSKYGLGYLMVDGSVGVYFNDSSKIILSNNGHNFEYIERSRRKNNGKRSPVVRQRHTLLSYPTELKKKVTLLKHFRTHLLQQQTPFDEAEKEEKTARSRSSGTSDLTYVKKWVKTRHAVLFRISDQTVQVSFFDNSEVHLYGDSRVCLYKDKSGKRINIGLDSVSAKRPDIAKRLRYTKDILHQLVTGSKR